MLLLTKLKTQINDTGDLTFSHPLCNELKSKSGRENETCTHTTNHSGWRPTNRTYIMLLNPLHDTTHLNDFSKVLCFTCLAMAAYQNCAPIGSPDSPDQNFSL